MSRGQTPLYWMANRTLSPSTLHTACPSSLSLSFSFSFFPSLLRSGSEMEEEEEEEEEGGEGGAGQREMNGRNYSTTLGATSRAAFSRNLPIEGPTDPPHQGGSVRSHFTIFRSEINAAPSFGPAFLFRRCLVTPAPFSSRTTQKTHAREINVI